MSGYLTAEEILRSARESAGADESLGSCLSPWDLPAQTKLPSRPVAVRTIIDHAAPCWHCSKRLQACSAEGKPDARRSGWSPGYRGAVIAWVAVVDGYERRLHSRCAEDLGFQPGGAR